jgi:hypothetical protein
MVLELRVDALLGVLGGAAALMAALRGFELWATNAVARADARAVAEVARADVARRSVDATNANGHD